MREGAPQARPVQCERSNPFHVGMRDLMPGLYLRHPSSFRHDTGGHPENARRLTAIEDAMSERDLLGLELVEAPAASRAQLERVHSAAHVDSIEAISAQGGGMIDDRHCRQRRLLSEAALHSAGGAVHATERLSVDGGFAFCGLRPPGHHAERERAMGFCLFNNVAVAARTRFEECGAERVLVLDWDVHHGKGTEAIFYSSSRVPLLEHPPEPALS